MKYKQLQIVASNFQRICKIEHWIHCKSYYENFFLSLHMYKNS